MTGVRIKRRRLVKSGRVIRLKRMRRYKVWGEYPARKEFQYFFARSRKELISKFTPLARKKIREGKIKVKYDGVVKDWYIV